MYELIRSYFRREVVCSLQSPLDPLMIDHLTLPYLRRQPNMPSRFTKLASQSVLTVVPILLVRKLFPFLRDPIRYQRILAFYREGLKQWNATQQENAYVKFYSWCDAARFIIALTKNKCFRFPFDSQIIIEKDVLIQFSLKRKTGPLGTQ
jgi:hypothetical protein